MSIDLEKQLKKFERTLKTSAKRAQDEGGFGSTLPDGRYKTQLIECVVGRAKSGKQRWQIEYKFKVNAGDYEGENIRKCQSIESEDDQVWVHRDLKRFGAQAPENMEQLLAIVNALNEAKPEVRVSLVTKDSGQFSYIDRVLESVEFGDLANNEEQEGEEDEQVEGTEEDEGSEDNAKEETTEESEETEESSEEDGEELKIGMRISFENKAGKTITGKITELLEKTGEVKVKVDDKVYKVSIDDLFAPKEELVKKAEPKKTSGMKLKKK